MDSLLHRWLRPTHRARRGVAALVVVALLGWLSLAAGHLHLDAGGSAVAHAHADGDPAHDHDHGDDSDVGGERSHPCGLCAAVERGAGPAAAPAFAIAACAHRAPAFDLPDRLTGARAPAPYRSRAPPHA